MISPYLRPASGQPMFLVVALVAVLLAMAPAAALQAANTADIVALTGTNSLIQFNSGAPGTILSTTSISGLQPGETILAIDFRPLTGQLYGLGSSSRLYVINLATGAATQVGSGTF